MSVKSVEEAVNVCIALTAEADEDDAGTIAFDEVGGTGSLCLRKATT